MKTKKILIILLLFISGYANATIDVNFADSVIKKDSQGNNLMKTEMKYDEHKNSTFYADYTWDSQNLKWIPGFKSVYEFDSFGNQIKNETFNWDVVLNSYVNCSNNVVTYDALGNQLVYEYYYYDVQNSVWVGSYKYEKAYDQNGKIVNEDYFNWDSNTNTWFKTSITTYTYSANNLINEQRQSYNSYDLVWEDFMKTDYTYNAAGLTTSKIEYMYNSVTSLWDNYTKNVIEYNEVGNETFNASYSWDNQTDSWVLSYSYKKIFDENQNVTFGENISSYNRELYIYEYDVTGKAIKCIDSIWNANTQSYDFKYLEEFEYDAFGNRILVTTTRPNSKEKAVYIYDENGIITEWISYDSINNSWIGKEKSVMAISGQVEFKSNYTFDAVNNVWVVTEMFDSFYTDFVIIPTISETNVELAQEIGSSNTVTITTNGDWTATSDSPWITISPSSGTGNSEITITAESEATSTRTAIVTVTSTLQVELKGIYIQTISVIQNEETSLSTQNSDEIVIYPNPASSEFAIHSNENVEVQVYDIIGQLVLHTNVASDENINVSALHSGLYQVKVISDNTVINQSLIIK